MEAIEKEIDSAVKFILIFIFTEVSDQFSYDILDLFSESAPRRATYRL